jgi:hypothetical protein
LDLLTGNQRMALQCNTRFDEAELLGETAALRSVVAGGAYTDLWGAAHAQAEQAAEACRQHGLGAARFIHLFVDRFLVTVAGESEAIYV